MNKSELISLAARDSGLTRKDTERALNAALQVIIQSMAQGEKVQLSGFGTFECKEREPRVGRNPHTRQAVQIPATTVPVFKPSKALRDLIAK